MNNLLHDLKIDKKEFKQIIKRRQIQNKNPSLVSFITPSLNFFDIFRLIKLSEINAAGFDIFLIIEESENQKESNSFVEIIDKFIPHNKKIFLYGDIIKNVLLDKEYKDMIHSYKINNLEKFNKNSKLSDFSLSDLNRFLTQYFILQKSNIFLGCESDFYLNTSYKYLFFKSIPNFNEGKLPIKILLEDIPLNWNFKESIKILERELSKNKISSKEFISIKKTLDSIKPLIPCCGKDRSLISIISTIKTLIEGPKLKREYFSTKSDFKDIILALNNEIRRQIMSIISERNSIKAEEIRNLINSSSKKKYSLTNIVKHLNILLSLKLIDKRKRSYSLSITRIILDIPFSWFAQD